MAFPEEITDDELVFALVEEILAGLKSDIKDKSDLSLLKVKVVQEDDCYQHKYTFSQAPQPQLMGMIASCMETVAERKIIEFLPKTDALVISFADEPPENDENEEE